MSNLQEKKNNLKKLRFKIILEEQTEFRELNKIVTSLEVGLGYKASIHKQYSEVGFYK